MVIERLRASVAALSREREEQAQSEGEGEGAGARLRELAAGLRELGPTLDGAEEEDARPCGELTGTELALRGACPLHTIQPPALVHPTPALRKENRGRRQSLRGCAGQDGAPHSLLILQGNPLIPF